MIERGVFVLWNDRWTVVANSQLDEVERLSFELTSRLDLPALQLWAYDSDLWSYELECDGQIVSAFNSNPRYWGPEEPPKGPNDVEALLSCLSLPRDLAGELSRLQSRRGVFKEMICGAFAQLIGAPAAATQYAYLWHGERVHHRPRREPPHPRRSRRLDESSRRSNRPGL